MKKAKPFLAVFLIASCFVSNAQNIYSTTATEHPKLIAVVNSANWCLICKANEQRFQELIMQYKEKGVLVYINDLTNDTTKLASKTALQQAHVYEAVTTIPRKNMGKMLRFCGLSKAKRTIAQASGIVTFINPATFKQLNQLSIASSNEKLTSTIDNLLK